MRSQVFLKILHHRNKSSIIESTGPRANNENHRNNVIKYSAVNSGFHEGILCYGTLKIILLAFTQKSESPLQKLTRQNGSLDVLSKGSSIKRRAQQAQTQSSTPAQPHFTAASQILRGKRASPENKSTGA